MMGSFLDLEGLLQLRERLQNTDDVVSFESLKQTPPGTILFVVAFNGGKGVPRLILSGRYRGIGTQGDFGRHVRMMLDGDTTESNILASTMGLQDGERPMLLCVRSLKDVGTFVDDRPPSQQVICTCGGQYCTSFPDCIPQ